MSTPREIRTAIKATVEALGVEVKVATAASDYTASTERYLVRVLVGSPADETEDRLDELLAPDGPSSVKEALERDRTLSGTVDDVYVQKHSGYRVFEIGPGEMRLGTEFTVDTIS